MVTLESRFRKIMGDVLGSPARTDIIAAVDERTRSFSELQKLSSLSSGNLGYHLLKAQATGLIERDAQNKYSITPLGQKVATILKQIGEANEKIC